MKIETNLVKAMLLLSFIVVAPTTPASAQNTIMVTTMLPPPHPIVTEFFRPWTAKMEAESQGTLTMDVRNGTTVANVGNIYERVMDDVVQIGWAEQGILGGRFPLTQVATLPFEAATAAQNSVALWRLYATGQLADEYNDVKPLVLMTFVGGTLHFARPPKALDDLTGLKVRGGSKMQADFVTRLGGTALSFSAAEQYEALQRGTIDAAVMGWSGVAAFKLFEVAKYHLNVELGTSTNMLFMAPRKFASLPAAARKAIDDNSGEIWSRAIGGMSDRLGAEAQNAVLGMPGQTGTELTAPQLAAWKQRLAPVIAEWVQAHPRGASVLAGYRAILADLKAGK